MSSLDSGDMTGILFAAFKSRIVSAARPRSQPESAVGTMIPLARYFLAGNAEWLTRYDAGEYCFSRDEAQHNPAEQWVKRGGRSAAARLSDAEFARCLPLFEADLRALAPLVDFDPLVWLERASAAGSWMPRWS